MSEKRFWFVIDKGKLEYVQDNVTGEKITVTELEDLLNELDDECKFLAKQKDYWKSKAMILLMQVRRLTPRMTDKEVKEFNKELEE